MKCWRQPHRSMALFKKKTERVAIVRVDGVISDSETDSTRTKIIKNLNKAYKAEVKAVVLRINSPGGTVGASQELHAAILKLREKGIPVVASMSDVAASGGVYIAIAADKIVANPGTITGSIGVIISSANAHLLMQKVGVSREVIKSGPFKDVLSPFRPMTDEERSLMQGVIDDAHDQFVEAVSKGRGIPAERVREFADGRIFTGRQAKEWGLVDELGGLQTAVELAGKVAGIEGLPKTIELGLDKPFWKKFMGPFGRTASLWSERAELQGVPLWLMPR